ncbi:NAD(P) transhydrogenase subunit alpha [Haloferula luteola]|uniref:proton-translocating NAD(P)(+) transhydrogenase n=1 Tax=Haloferula luteola TaxID=595692 RepID=A0A840V685_9BACT|nr:NAD(P) transhydrogenase subunit alpha [Haloferula luteola]MBB5353535.1 NAD(P) transhydrogenase subunit alpha [Haloferula luteola]
MLLYALNEVADEETRCGLSPESTRKLVGLGLDVAFEPGLGSGADFSDAEYEAMGAKPMKRLEGLTVADVVLWVTPPPAELLGFMKRGAMAVGFLAPFSVPLGGGEVPLETPEKARLDALVAGGITGISVELMPRSTLAQKMDAISSQANLAGYVAMVLAASRMNKILPMMMTPSGTISPAKVFVIGIGVAGLQAIATAKRLGARVTAFDTRAEALEQAESLGAKALRIDLGETGSTDQGYARELTPDQVEKQRLGQAKVCAESDIVLCTAKLFGRRAPLLVGREVVASMRSGAIIVDLAAETGGNVEGTVIGEETVTENGVRIVGHRRLECWVARDASAMYANNLAHFIEHFWDGEAKCLRHDPEDPILKGATLTREGAFVNPHPAFSTQA